MSLKPPPPPPPPRSNQQASQQQFSSNNPFRRLSPPEPDMPISAPPVQRSTNPFLDYVAPSPSPPPGTQEQTRSVSQPPPYSRSQQKSGQQQQQSSYHHSSRSEKKPSRSSSDRDRQRERERDRRHHHSSSREHSSSVDHKDKDAAKKKSSSSKKKKGPPLDTIDKLDVTGFFGPGNFHHDGPFDACTPHRNKSNNQKAPVKAYAIDGPNNTISGTNLNKDDNDMYMGIGKGGEAFQDFSRNDATLGLGDSTFLDGTPVAENTAKQQMLHTQQGLSRKKSLAQRLRGGNGAGPQVSRESKFTSTSTTRAVTPPPQSSPSSYNGGDAPLLLVDDQSPPRQGGNGLLRRVKSLRTSRR